MRAFLPVSLMAMTACAQGPANAATANFNVRDFDQVALQGPDSIHVIPGNAFSVTAEGPQEALDKLNIRVEQGVLKVSRKEEKGWNWGGWRNKARALVTVTLPAIRAASLSGAGDLDVSAPVKGDHFTASLSGAGDLKIRNAAVHVMDVRLSGAGNISLIGTADQLAAGVSGSGNVEARSLAARTAQLSVSGVGNINARVSEIATGGVSGVGNVSVVGGARCDLKKSGVGSVHCAP